MRLICEGKTDKEIALIQDCSIYVAVKRLNALREKLEESGNGRVSLALKAVRMGIIDLEVFEK